MRSHGARARQMAQSSKPVARNSPNGEAPSASCGAYCGAVLISVLSHGNSGPFKKTREKLSTGC